MAAAYIGVFIIGGIVGFTLAAVLTMGKITDLEGKVWELRKRLLFARASGAKMNESPILQYCRECGWEGTRWRPPVTTGPNPCPAANLGDCPYCGEDLEAVMGDGVTETEPTAWLQDADALLEHEEP